MLLTYIKYVLSAGVIVTVLYYISKVDFSQIVDLLVSQPYLMLIILCTSGCSYLLATIAWAASFSDQGRPYLPSILQLFAIRLAGESISILTPLNIVGGELSKFYLLRQRQLDYDEILQSLVHSRWYLILSYGGIALTTLILLCVLHSLKSLILILLITLLFVLITSRYQLVTHIWRRLNGSLRERVSVIAHKIGSRVGLPPLKMERLKIGKIQKAKILTFSIAHWIVGMTEVYFILQFIDVDITWLGALTFEMGTLIIRSLGAFVPGQIGIEEYGNRLMLSILHIDSLEIWLGVSIIRRTRQIIWILLGLLSYCILLNTIKWKSFLLPTSI